MKDVLFEQFAEFEIQSSEKREATGGWTMTYTLDSGETFSTADNGGSAEFDCVDDDSRAVQGNTGPAAV